MGSSYSVLCVSGVLLLNALISAVMISGDGKKVEAGAVPFSERED